LDQIDDGFFDCALRRRWSSCLTVVLACPCADQGHEVVDDSASIVVRVLRIGPFAERLQRSLVCAWGGWCGGEYRLQTRDRIR
jgi:hypothetical protein